MTTTVTTTSDLHPLVGQHLGYSRWIDVTQERVNQFADATDDHQWIHTDPERASKESPFGTAIAHGYLTMSLLIPLLGEVLVVEKTSLSVNYGLNKVRFPAPVPAGSKIRLGATLGPVDTIAGGVQVVADVVIECEGVDKPVCIAQPVFRFLD